LPPPSSASLFAASARSRNPCAPDCRTPRSTSWSVCSTTSSTHRRWRRCFPMRRGVRAVSDTASVFDRERSTRRSARCPSSTVNGPLEGERGGRLRVARSRAKTRLFVALHRAPPPCGGGYSRWRRLLPVAAATPGGGGRQDSRPPRKNLFY
jgi:hypothetical protein